MTKKALTLALEALKLGDTVFYPQTSIAIAAIEGVLAQPEQEPDYKAIGQQAYESGYSTGYMDCAVKMKAQTEQDCTRSHPHEEMSKECELRTEIARLRNKLANRTWIGLDAEEIRKTDHHMVVGAYHYSFRQGARWAEEALKERNK